MAAKVIAFVNFKEGVGKTANVVNIGASRAMYYKKRVLIVDLDAQSNSSLWLMKPDEWRKHTKVDPIVKELHFPWFSENSVPNADCL